MDALKEAHDIIHGDREKTYGAPDKNLKTIAAYWSTHLKARFGFDAAITPQDVCVMMVCLKAARLANDMQHRDSIVDGAGYFGLMDRVNNP